MRQTKTSPPPSTSRRSVLRATATLPVALFSTAGCFRNQSGPSVPEHAAQLPSDDLFLNPKRASQRFDDMRISLKDRKIEVATKLKRVRAKLEQADKDALLFTSANHFSWITAGAEDHIVHSSSDSPVQVLVTRDAAILLTNNIEGPRMVAEVAQGLDFEVQAFPFTSDGQQKALSDIVPDPARILTDGSGSGMTALRTDELLELLFPLTPTEEQRFRWLGHKCSEVVESIASVIQPGMTEFDVQYLLAREMWYWDIFTTVNLASADERVLNFKHPFPVGKRIERYLNINTCARRWGMVISMSRLMHFGKPDARLLEVFDTGGQAMAAMMHKSHIGAKFGDILAANEAVFDKAGHVGEAQRHLQGGPILTSERITLLRAFPEGQLSDGMAVAYNPTCKGSKHEDTFFVRKGGLELVSPRITWPVRTYEVAGKAYEVADLKIVG